MLHVNFNTYNNYVTDSLYQWDINQDLVISGLNLPIAPEIHFANANMNRAIVRQSTLNSGVVTVRIPNSILQEAATIKAYVGLYDGDTFKVVETIEIPVIAKARPVDYVFEDTSGEIYSFKALENTIADLVSPDGKDAVVRLKDLNEGRDVTFWVGTQAEYEALTEIRDNCLYIISDEKVNNSDLAQLNAEVRAIKEKVDQIAVYITGTGTDSIEKYQTIKYSNGYAESAISVRLTNVPLTTSFGNFYTFGQARHMSMSGVNNKPEVCSIIVDGVQKYNDEGDLVRGPEAFAMVSGAAAYDDISGTCYTPHFVIIANGAESAAVVDLTINVRWRWK